MRIRGLMANLLLVVFSGAACVDGHLIGRQQQRPVDNKADHQHAVSDQGQQQLPPEIVSLIDSARAAPAEFAADALIRIVESNKVSDRESRRELLEEAFRLAPGAEQSIKRTLAGGPVDTSSGYLSNALRLNLDALSLQLRAVKAMLRVDEQKAGELFSQIPKLQLKPLTCEDALAYDVSDFYETLKEIAQRTFSPEDMDEGKHLQFIDSYVTGMSNPSQVAPLVETILSLKTSPSQLEMLVLATSRAWRKISNDDRSFSFSLVRYPVLQMVDHLMLTCKRQTIPNEELLAALRTYLVTQASGSRCADTVTKAKGKPAPLNFVDYFNNTLLPRVYPGQRKILPISENEIRPSRIEGPAKTYPYWQSSESKKLLSNIRKLRFGSKGKEVTASEKENPEWQSRLMGFLNELAAWTVTQEKSEADYFHQKSVLFRTLLEMLPTGPTRDDVLNNFVMFLADSPMQRESRVEWFLHASYLVNKARSSQSDERSKMLQALSRSGNLVLNLYAELERRLAESPKDAH